MSCMSGSWNLENDTTRGETGSYQVRAWKAEQGSRPTRPTSRHPREDVGCVGRVGEDVTMMP